MRWASIGSQRGEGVVLSVLEVCSLQGAIQIHLTLPRGTCTGISYLGYNSSETRLLERNRATLRVVLVLSDSCTM